jgi:hypothetical protein
MRQLLFMRLIIFFSLCSLGILLASYSGIKNDPYATYRDKEKKPLSIEPKQLKYFFEAELLIRQKLKLDLSQREETILAGLHSLITFADNDDNFDRMFGDFMLLMNVLSHSENRIHQHEVVELVIKTSLLRIANKLDQFFDNSEQARWGFIWLLPIIEKYPEIKNTFTEFYRKNFGPHAAENDIEEFRQAMQTRDYKTLFGYLLNRSFLHYYLAMVKEPEPNLPPDTFEELLKEFKNFKYVDHDLKSSQFRGLGYLATHIVLFLTNYGQFSIRDGGITTDVKKYLESTLDKAYKLGDFDLFAEYIECMKILNHGATNSNIKNLEKFIYSLQHPDGSFGSERYARDPYSTIHPTGAALMAINQSNDEELAAD